MATDAESRIFKKLDEIKDELSSVHAQLARMDDHGERLKAAEAELASLKLLRKDAAMMQEVQRQVTDLRIANGRTIGVVTGITILVPVLTTLAAKLLGF